MITADQFKQLLLQHDWDYERSDDTCEYRKGAASRDRLLGMCQEQPEFFCLYNHLERCFICGEPLEFPAEQPEHQTQNTNTNNMDITALGEAFFAP